MKLLTKKSFFYITCLMLFLSAIGCGKKEEPVEEEVVQPVKTIIVNSKDALTTSYPAILSAANKVDLSFRVQGTLIELNVKEGDEIEKEQIIARIDPRDYELAVRQEQANYRKAESDFERYRELYENGVAPAIEFDQKKTARDVAKSKLEQAELNLAYTYLKAPFKSRIGERFVENFQDVQAKQAVVSIHDISKIEVIIDLPENTVSSLQEENKGRFVAIFSSIPGKEFDLEIKEFNINADRVTQTYRATFIMAQPEGAVLLPGMTATVKRYLSFSKDKSSNPYIVPFNAVVSNENEKPFVWVVDPNDITVSKRVVKLGTISGSGNVEIIEGLSDGERIVTAGVSKLYESQKIRLIN